MDERVYLVTGVGSGMGRHLANTLAERGCRMVVTDLDAARLQAHAAAAGWSDETTCLQTLDVRDEYAWERVCDAAVARFGRLDVLLNVAGFLRPGYAHALSGQDIHRHIDINVKGVIFGTTAAAWRMVNQGSGHIVNIASLAGLAPVPGLSLYSASKFAVRSFSIAAAYDLKPHGVAVTAVCPDAVATPMLDRQVPYEEAALTFSASRVLTVEEVTAALLGPVLDRRPLEYVLPASRGWLAKLANLAPGLAGLLQPALRGKGLRAQRDYATDRSGNRQDS
jgi:3-oxoacyl-[acyl-carrier protein] reductase